MERRNPENHLFFIVIKQVVQNGYFIHKCVLLSWPINKTMKVIITGATGMVGEGVLLECLQQELVKEILLVGRRHYDLNHPKVKELLVTDFLDIEPYADQLQGYDACFYCAGVSSVGMNEKDYTRITYDTTIAFAQVVLKKNPHMVFTYVSGQGTDSSESGRLMWARVKGRTENEIGRAHV